MELGLRVVRGPHWNYNNQDGGEGHVGTVVEIGRSGSFAHKMVKVQWDSGHCNGYRAGFQDCYDLRIVDSAPSGRNHRDITCESCWKQNIAGMRWKCKLCINFNLCTQCYMADQHDLTHPFLLYETFNSPGVEVRKREGDVKITKKGIFVSAKVTDLRDKGNKDGGMDKVGVVLEIRSRNYGEKNVAYVLWPSGGKSECDVGRDGKVALKYTEAATDGGYYRYHLPYLGYEMRTKESEDCKNVSLKETDNIKGDEITAKEKDDKFAKNNKSWAHLSQNLEDLFLSDQLCDFTIKMADREFKIHKTILGARSSVFASMLQHDMKEKNTGIVEIFDCDHATFEDFLYYLYSGKTERISHKNVTSLYELAEKYDIQGLKEECVHLMKRSLSVDFICEAMALAVRHGDKELLKMATEYFVSNVKEILPKVKWQIFMKENPVPANELYIKAFNTALNKD